MKTVDCGREDDVLDALTSGRWPDRADDELRSHVATCAICADVIARSVRPICGSLPLPSMRASTAAPAVVPSRRSDASTFWFGRNAARMARKTGFSAKGPSMMMRALEPMASSDWSHIKAQ